MTTVQLIIAALQRHVEVEVRGGNVFLTVDGPTSVRLRPYDADEAVLLAARLDSFIQNRSLSVPGEYELPSREFMTASPERTEGNPFWERFPLALYDVTQSFEEEQPDGSVFLRTNLAEVATHRDEARGLTAFKSISVFDLLILIACQDAREAGRDDDAERLADLILPCFGTKLTEDQEREIIAHLHDERPVLVRSPREVTELSGVHTRRNVRKNKGTGLEYTTAGAANDLIIVAASGAKLNANAGTMILLGQLLAIHTDHDTKPDASGTITVHTSMDELLGDGPFGRGEVNDAENRRTIRNQLCDLASLQIRRNGSDGPDGGIVIGDSWSAKNPRRVVFTFGKAFTSQIASQASPQQPWDPRVFKIDYRRYPAAYPLYLRLKAHEFMNFGTPTETRLSVNAIIDGLKVIPSESRVKNRHFTERRIVPFEAALNHLVGIGILRSWRYCHAGGAPLTEEEEASRASRSDGALPHSYATATSGGSNVTLIEWEPSREDYGYMLARDDRKRTRLAEARRRREENEARQERRDKIIDEKVADRIADKLSNDYIAKNHQ